MIQDFSIMAPNKKSIVQKYYDKNNEKSVKFKLYQKNVKTAGNTSDLMAHIKHIHKAVYLDIFLTKDIPNVTWSNHLDSNSLIPGTSKKNQTSHTNDKIFIIYTS